MPSKKGPKSFPKILLSNENDKMIPEQVVADYMNTFFANIGTPSTVLDGEVDDRPMVQSQKSDNQDINFTLDPITNFEVELLINKINASKSSGITSLSSKLF